MLLHALEAVEVGVETLQDFLRRNTPLEIRSKGPTDYVTQVDRAVEDAVFSVLRERYPRHFYIGEEGTGEGLDTHSKAPQWILDPLDGTANFCHGFPHYCISLALYDKGALQIGIICDPMRGETFTAQRGRGALLMRKRLRTSRATNLKDALLANCHHAPLGNYEFDNLSVLRGLYQNELIIRRTGSAALDLAYVAAGRLDAFWGNGLRVWDMAAGVLMVQEAGGRVSDYRGHPNPLDGDHVLACAPLCLKPMFAAISPAYRELPSAQS